PRGDQLRSPKRGARRGSRATQAGRIENQGTDSGPAGESRRSGDRGGIFGRALPARRTGGGVASRARRKGTGISRQGESAIAELPDRSPGERQFGFGVGDRLRREI